MVARDGGRRLTWYVPAMEFETAQAVVAVAVIGGIAIGLLVATLLIVGPKKKPRRSDEENRPPG